MTTEQRSNLALLVSALRHGGWLQLDNQYTWPLISNSCYDRLTIGSGASLYTARGVACEIYLRIKRPVRPAGWAPLAGFPFRYQYLEYDGTRVLNADHIMDQFYGVRLDSIKFLTFDELAEEIESYAALLLADKRKKRTRS